MGIRKSWKILVVRNGRFLSVSSFYSQHTDCQWSPVASSSAKRQSCFSPRNQPTKDKHLKILFFASVTDWDWLLHAISITIQDLFGLFWGLTRHQTKSCKIATCSLSWVAAAYVTSSDKQASIDGSQAGSVETLPYIISCKIFSTFQNVLQQSAIQIYTMLVFEGG